MRFSSVHRYTFDCRGWVAIDGALDRQTVADLRAAVAAKGLAPAGTTVASQRFGQDGEMFRWDRRFRDLLDHRLVLDALAQLVGPRPRLDHAYGIRMAPGTSGLGLHGPEQPFDPSQFYVHRGGRMWNGMVAFSWALTDGKPGDGGFGCISGSHRAEEPVPPGADGLVEEVPQAAGSLLVFTEALFHRTLPWNGQGERQCLLYKYCPGNSAWGADPPVPPDVVAQLTPRQRLLVERPYVAGRPRL
ncbi:MAG TPA: phytanoyl-CoA dioxygenase family protein [Acidimicrobiales bacterium]